MSQNEREETNDARPDTAPAEPQTSGYWASGYWATWTVGAVLIILLIQFAVSVVRTEPYPAFLFPGFASVPFSTTTVQVRDVRIQLATEDGNVHELPPSHVFYTVPPVHSHVLTQRLFQPGSILAFAKANPADSSMSPLLPANVPGGGLHDVYVPISDRDTLRERWRPRWHEDASLPDLRQQFRTYLRSHPRFDSLSPPETLVVRWERRTIRKDGVGRSHPESTYLFPLLEE